MSAQALGNNRPEAIRAPSLSAVSFAHTTSSATRPAPAAVSNPQSVPGDAAAGIAKRACDALDPLGHDFGMLDEIRR